jgi:hypothetical protein
VQPELDRRRHQQVPGGVEGDLVEPAAVTVVGAQLRRVRVGLDGPTLDLSGAGKHTKFVQPGERCSGSVAACRFNQRVVVGEDVSVDQRWRLVGDDVRGCHFHTVRAAEPAVPDRALEKMSQRHLDGG